MKYRLIIPVVVISLFSVIYSKDKSHLPTLDPDVEAMVNSITENESETLLRTLVNFQSRVSTNPGCQKACEWARDQFNTWGLDSVYLNKYSSSYAPNVVAIKKGTKAVQDSIFIIGGHIDDMSSSSSFAPGADDNGSGTICAMLVAKAMSKYKFRNEVRYVLFTAEEQAFAGSKAYVNDHKSEKIKAVIINDMLLWYRSGDTDFDIEAQTSYRWIGNFLVTAAKDYVGFTAKVNNPST